MPTFSARLSPKSHFPGPKTGIVFGLFLLILKINVLRASPRNLLEFLYSVFFGYITTKIYLTIHLRKNQICTYVFLSSGYILLFPLMCDQEVSEQILSHKQLLYTVVLPGVRSHEMSAVFLLIKSALRRNLMTGLT